MEILELCDEKDWQDREAFWVEFYLFRFGETQVLNVMEGGVQSGRFMKHSAATCERLRQMFKGRPIPQEQREQISKSLTGLKQSKETVEKRLATWAKRREEAGLPPLQRFETWEEYRAAGAENRSIFLGRKRDTKTALPSWDLRNTEKKQAEKQRAYFASLPDEQRQTVFAATPEGNQVQTKGKNSALSLQSVALRNQHA